MIEDNTNQPTRTIDPKAYGAFIQQIELLNIWLSSATVENNLGPIPPEPGRVSIAEDFAWEAIDSGFISYHTYSVRMRDDQDIPAADVKVTFGLEFSSVEPMTDDLFATFARVNLPINSWPYLREFFASVVGRMGWIPLTLPSLKVGTDGDQAGRPNSRGASQRPKSRTSTSSEAKKAATSRQRSAKQ